MIKPRPGLSSQGDIRSPTLTVASPILVGFHRGSRSQYTAMVRQKEGNDSLTVVESKKIRGYEASSCTYKENCEFHWLDEYLVFGVRRSPFGSATSTYMFASRLRGLMSSAEETSKVNGDFRK